MQQPTMSGAAARISARTHAEVTTAVAQDEVDSRLADLDDEWDVERLLFTVSGLNLLVGLVLARLVGRRWLAYPAVVAAFQVQHGVQGWCPPFALLRRFGVRTRREIDAERAALKAIRGDFSDAAERPDSAVDAALA